MNGTPAAAALPYGKGTMPMGRIAHEWVLCVTKGFSTRQSNNSFEVVLLVFGTEAIWIQKEQGADGAVSRIAVLVTNGPIEQWQPPSSRD